MGYHYSVVLGSKDYYKKTGYEPAKNFGILAPFEVDGNNFMVKRLNNTDKEINGVVNYAKEFKI